MAKQRKDYRITDEYEHTIVVMSETYERRKEIQLWLAANEVGKDDWRMGKVKVARGYLLTFGFKEAYHAMMFKLKWSGTEVTGA